MKHPKKTGVWLISIIALVMAISPASVAQPHPLAKHFSVRAHTHAGFTLPYRLFVPERYNPGHPYPVVLVLHGAGKIGDDNESHLNHKVALWADNDIQRDYPSIIIAPQCPRGYSWTSKEVRTAIFDMIDTLGGAYSINQRKIYISGGSMGGSGAWVLPTYRPYQFTAAIPISGGNMPAKAALISHLSFWVIHGRVDDVVPVERSRRMISAFERLGRTCVYTHCHLMTDDCAGMTGESIRTEIDKGATLLYSEYPHERHGIAAIHFGNANVFRWLYQQEKPDAWFVADEMHSHISSVTSDQDHLVRTTPIPVTIDVTFDRAIAGMNDVNELVLDVSQHNTQGDVFVPLQEITPTFYSVSYTLTASQAGEVGLTLMLKGDAGQYYPLFYHGLPSFEGMLTSGLVTYWALDQIQGEIAYDSAGQNTASTLGGPVWRPGAGKVDGALQFDGIDDALIAAAPLNAADGPFSVLVWIKGGAAGQAIISEPDGPDWLSLAPQTGHLMTELTNTGRFARPLQSEAVIADGAWHQIGFVWDGAYRTLYVDGVVQAQDSQRGLESAANALYIGTGNAMIAGTYFSGLADDIRIYARALREDEIAALAN